MEDTAILITFDESGGLYDSGYIQPIDFFGDGPRTVLIAVSPFAKRGHVDHTYADHASILKFIEWNWTLPSLSSRSRDNLPNPIASPNAPYFPLNSPAIGDLRPCLLFSNQLQCFDRRLRLDLGLRLDREAKSGMWQVDFAVRKIPFPLRRSTGLSGDRK